jgi:hypothetical protein
MIIRKIILVFVIVLALFLYLDNKAYYYGLGGSGFLSSKLPPRFEILFAGSDLGNQGMILKENDMNLHIIRKNDSLFKDEVGKKTIINKFVGYWFDDKIIVAKIKDKSNNNRYIEVYEEVTNNLYPKFICKEINYAPNKLERLKYIDLDKSLSYFKKLKLFKNISFFLSALSLIYLFRVLYESKR